MWRLPTLAGMLGVLLLSWHPTPTRLEVSNSYFPWEPVGPSNLGHIYTTGIRVGNKVYAGTAYGGVYVSEDNGRSWIPVPGLCLNQNGEAVYRAFSISALAASGQALYVGTGLVSQFNPAGVSYRNVDSLRVYIPGAFGGPGMGVFLSEDGGQTFSNQNATWELTYPNVAYSTRHSGSLQITTVVDIAASGDNVVVLTPDSILLSTDKLQTVQVTGVGVNVGSLRSAAWGADGVLFLATSQRLFRSVDTGQTFVDITGSLPLPSGVSTFAGGTVRVRTAPSNPSVVYVASSGGNGRLVSVWVSTDNGQTWTQLAAPQNASFNVLDESSILSLALRVDPRDPARILIGGLQIWEFTPDRGWQRINPPNLVPPVLSLPRPIRDFVILEDGSFLVLGTGRLIRIRDNGTYAENADRGIQSAAILSVAVAPNGDVHASGLTPLNLGFHYTESDPPQLFRLGNFPAGVFAPVAAPIGNLVVSYRDPQTVCFSYADGRMRQSRERGSEYVSIYNPPSPIAFYRTTASDTVQFSRTASDQDRPERFGPLYPPMVLIEDLPELIQGRDRTLYGKSHFFIATSGRLWYVSNFIPPNIDSLQYWSSVSNTNISNVTSSHTYATYLNAANTIPTAMGGSMLPDSSITVWIGTSNGRLYRIQEAQDITLDRSSSKDLEDLTSAISGLVDERTISAIAVHPNNPDLLAIAVSSYRTPVDRIFLSTNATSANPTFTSIHANLPNIPVYSLFFHPDSSALLLAGTHWGLWRCPDVINNPQWEEMTGEIVGRVPVTSIAWKPYRYQVDTVDRSDPDNILTEARLLPDPERPIYIGTWGRGIWKINSRSATALPTAANGTPIRIEVFPNPFSNEVNIRVALPTGARRISWQLLNLNGQRIATHTHNGQVSSGEHTFRWAAGSLAHGIYFLQVEVIDSEGRRFTETRKLLHQ